MLLGAHMSTAGGLHTAFERAEEVDCTALQIFTSSPRQWKGRDLSALEVEKFEKAWQASKVEDCVAHDIYLTRLGTRDATILEKSIDAFVHELTTCQRLGLAGLVMHPVGDDDPDVDAVLDRVAGAFDRIFDVVPDEGTAVCLEITAGQGANVGYRFEQLARIRDGIGAKDRVAICLDTCHLFAAGYDISTDEGYDATMAELDDVLGIDLVRVIHVNDSQKGLGSRVDRHAHIGEGEIGERAFKRIMTDERFAGVPKLLETPKEDDMDRVNLDRLRRMARGTG